MKLHRLAWVALAVVLGCASGPPPATSSAALASDTAAADSQPASDTVAASDTGPTGAADTATAAPDTTADATADTAPEDLAQAPDVPQEPCGVVKDKVICDTWLQGRLRNEKTGLATAADFAPFNVVELLKTTDQKYAVVMLGAWWCGKCRAATSLVVSKLAQYHDKACFANLLVEGQTPSVPAKKSDIDSWIGLMKVPFTVGGDDPSTAFQLRKTYGPRETTYVLERATGKILVKAANAAIALQELDKLP